MEPSQGWSKKGMACAARGFLLKLIVQAIPTFSMCCFLLTKKILKQLSSSMAKFWWSGSIDKQSLHWLSWDKLTAPNLKGGIGFWDFQQFNLALLGKQGWQLLTHPDSLCSKVLKGKYFPNCHKPRLQILHPQHGNLLSLGVQNWRWDLSSKLVVVNL